MEIACEIEDRLIGNVLSREELIIREKFLEEIFLFRKQNKLEIRAISRNQLDQIIKILASKDTK